MFQFLIGVAFGAAGYWAWQSFGRDLLGMGGDQDMSYGSFNSNSNSGSTPTTYGSSTGGSSTTTSGSGSTPTGGSSTSSS
jgi:hypothetical protein